MGWNIRSHNKFKAKIIDYLIEEHNPDIIILIETWLTQDISIRNYQTF